MSNKSIEKLLALADEAERNAAAYRLAAAALNGHAVNKRAARATSVLDAAIAVDAERREGKSKKKKHGAWTVEGKLEQRARTAKILETVAERGPITYDDLVAVHGQRIAMGALTGRGFIKRVGNKYRRTSKPFVVDWREKPAP